VENIWHASQNSHADIVACISGDKKGAAHIRCHSDIFLETFSETNWIFEFLSGKYPISKNKSSKMESGN
jgi:hypothetical protein